MRLARLLCEDEEKRQKIADLVTCLENNRKGLYGSGPLRDKVETKMVLVCSTGAMEKNIETVIGRRFKKYGMNWTTKGVKESVLTLASTKSKLYRERNFEGGKMGNFYDDWLRYWDEEQEERRKARTYINEEDLEWVRTKQDWRVALLCAREIGYITSGVAMVAEIPQGWHTGRHSHGEEAIYIIQGKGFSVVDELRYDWETGSCLFMPFGSAHQHFNSGEDTVRYFSAMALPLERFAGLARVVQYEEVGETPLGESEKTKVAESDIHPEYGRIVLRAKDAPVVSAKGLGEFRAKVGGEFFDSMAKEMRTAGIPGHRSREIQLMWDPQNNFKAREVEITAVLCDEPGMNSGKHAHMEAVLYVLQGEGYSIVDGEKISWKKGTCFHVQGPQTVHQHFNTGKIEAQQLRIHFGLRAKYFQPIAKHAFPYLYYEYGSYTQ